MSSTRCGDRAALAARKFGAGTARHLAVRLARIDDAERLGAIGEAVIDGADGAELLRRAEGGAEPG